ncbi:MAG: hypothetical protein AUJ97_08700 [Bacteroidetes bacterium CG2_30_32_10]|nr:MAG: hypothetical protein AUJ97_08700 [Bacteroidetes bacterium CG2_30_32_10]
MQVSFNVKIKKNKHLKSKIIIISIFFISLLLIRCSSIRVFHIDKDRIPEKTQGNYYALPQTVLIVNVSVKKTDKIKGPYASYASKYLGLTNVITQNSTSYDISEITISSYVEPDPNQYYFIKTKGKFRNIINYLEFNEAGLINSINEQNNSSITNTSSLVKDEGSNQQIELFAKLSAENNLYEKIDTIIEKVNLDTITIEKKILKKTMVEKSMEQKSKDAADFLMQLKEAKYHLLNGYNEVNYTKESIEYMNTQLDKMENEYLTLFAGLTVTHNLKYSYTYIPDENEISSPLFKFSEKKGIIDIFNEKIAGDTFLINIFRNFEIEKLSYYFANKEKLSSSHGIYYRIPQYSKVTISQNEQNYADVNLLIAQFGILTNLPAKKYKVEFYPNTGAIKNITAD